MSREPAGPIHGPAGEAGKGVAFAVMAYVWWGAVFPLYLRLLADVDVLEILALRVVSGVPLLVGLLAATGQLRELYRAFTSGPRLRALVVTTLLILVNWYAFIYAVVENRLSEASFGYYINPILSVALGVAFLGERLGRAGRISVSLALVGIVWLGFSIGGLPWIAVVLAVSWALYGLFRKREDAPAAVGLAVEMILLTPMMLVLEAWLIGEGRAVFPSGLVGGDLERSLLLLLAGAMTVLPLTLFNAAARRIRLATIGLLQYLSPTGQFVLAFFVFGEALDAARLGAFALIWLALGVFVYGAVRARRAGRPPEVAA